MSIILIGLNHHTAPVHVRERVALKGAGLQAALEVLVGPGRPGGADTNHPPAREAVIVSTCNRFELYVIAEDAQTTRATFEQCLAGRPIGLRSHLYVLEDKPAVS